MCVIHLNLQALKYGIGNTTKLLIDGLDKDNMRFFNSTMEGNSALSWWRGNVSAYGQALNGEKFKAATSLVQANIDLFGGKKSESKQSQYHNYVDPEFMTYWLTRATKLYMSNSVMVLAQNRTKINSVMFQPNQNAPNGTALAISG